MSTTPAPAPPVRPHRARPAEPPRLEKTPVRAFSETLHINPETVKRILWRGKIGPAFWTITGLISLVVNLVLIVILLAFGKELFTIKQLVTEDVLGGFYTNFIKMDEAHIVTTVLVSDTIQVVDTIPVVFDLPLEQDTVVNLTQDTPIPGATIYINGAAVPMYIVLPKGTPLSINLSMTVPVEEQVPVVLNVPVRLTVPIDIPLVQTELHEPFVGLQEVVGPFYNLMGDLPDKWEQTPLCGQATRWACKLLFSKE